MPKTLILTVLALAAATTRNTVREMALEGESYSASFVLRRTANAVEELFDSGDPDDPLGPGTFMLTLNMVEGQAVFGMVTVDNVLLTPGPSHHGALISFLESAPFFTVGAWPASFGSGLDTNGPPRLADFIFTPPPGHLPRPPVVVRSLGRMRPLAVSVDEEVQVAADITIADNRDGRYSRPPLDVMATVVFRAAPSEAVRGVHSGGFRRLVLPFSYTQDG